MLNGFNGIEIDPNFDINFYLSKDYKINYEIYSRKHLIISLIIQINPTGDDNKIILQFLINLT